jgi:hypothetical protein
VTKQLRLNALPRLIVWAALALMSLYMGIRLATGAGRNIAFQDLEWTTTAVIQVVAITAVFAGVFGYAAYRTYICEVKPPDGEGARFPGVALSLFGDAFMAVVGGLLLLAAVFMILNVPEASLAGNHPRYRSYSSASVVAALVPGLLFAFFGVLLMLVRRSVWEARPNKPIVRFWSRSFGRARPAPRDIMLFWQRYYGTQGAERVPVAWCLHGAIDQNVGFEIMRVPLETPRPVLERIHHEWRDRLAAMAAGHNQILERSPFEQPAIPDDAPQIA